MANFSASDEQMMYWLKRVVLGFVVFFVLYVFFSSFGTISAGHRGIMLNFGAVQKEALGEGLYFKTPIVQKVVEMDVRVQKLEITASAASQDLQTVSAQVALNYHVNPAKVTELYQDVGVEYQEGIISPALQEAVKSATAQYTAEQLVTKREEVRNKVLDLIKVKIEKRGIIADAFNIINFSFSQAFEQAIEAKVTAKQNAQAAENKREQSKAEAEQKIEVAKGDAEAMRLNAVARAEAISIEGRALAANQNVVQLREQEKWLGLCPIRAGVTCVFDKEGVNLLLNQSNNQAHAQQEQPKQ